MSFRQLHCAFTTFANTPNEVMSMNFDGWLGQVHTHMLSISLHKVQQVLYEVMNDSP